MSSGTPPRSGQEPELPERPEGAPRFAPPVSPTPGPPVPPAAPYGAPPAPPQQPPGGAWPPPASANDAPPRFVMTDEQQTPPEQETPWRGWMAWVALFSAFAAAFFGGGIVLVIGTAFGMDASDPTPAANIAALVVQDTAFVLSAILFARMAGPVSPKQFGIQRTPWGPAIGWAVLVAIGFYVFSATWAALIDISETDQLPDSLGVDSSTLAFIAVCLLVTVVAPVTEEFLFRGFFFGALRNWKGIWPAAIITGVIFGGIHAGGTNVEYLPPLMMLGFLLCVLRWKTGSLLPCIALHAFNNAIAFGVNAADWNAWQVILLIFGAVGVSLLVCLPFLGSADRAQARPAT